MVSVNDMLIGVMEDLMIAGRVPGLPEVVYEELDELRIDTGRLQVVLEWVVEERVAFLPSPIEPAEHDE